MRGRFRCSYIDEQRDMPGRRRATTRGRGNRPASEAATIALAAGSDARDAGGGGGGGTAAEKSGGRLPGVDAAVKIPSVARVCALCCLFRVLNTCAIRSYFEPDEFWQAPEPAYCRAFQRKGATKRATTPTTSLPPVEERAHAQSDPYLSFPGFTWEWKRKAPPLAPSVGNASVSTYASFLYAFDWDTRVGSATTSTRRLPRRGYGQGNR